MKNLIISKAPDRVGTYLWLEEKDGWTALARFLSPEKAEMFMAWSKARGIFKEGEEG
jgi:hypothetical protein